MNPNLLDFDLPVGEALPPPPPATREALEGWQDDNLADFYRSPHYETWYARTLEEMRNAEPFVMD